MQKSIIRASALAMVLFGASAQALLLPATGYVTYGDANSYSLPILALMNDAANGGGTGPGSPYYVDSSPGQIQNLIVVATGSSGGPVNTNFAGMDNAYSTPTGVNGSTFFSTVTTMDTAGQFAGDQATTWDSTLSALTTFLGGDSPIFFFNNNQVNSGAATNQNLAAWAQVSLTGVGLPTLYFDLTNQDSRYALVSEGGGGTFNGSPALYTSTGAGPTAGDNSSTDYVLSGGEVCLTSTFFPISCSLPHTYGPINQNLGANQAVYAIVFPELNSILATSGFLGYSAFHLDLRLGCDPATAAGSCVARDLNNGYEQLFIGRQSNPTVRQVPEPASVALLGGGLLGMLLVFSRRRKHS